MEAEFVRLVRYIDLYLQQKTDLFLQRYVFEPLGFLAVRVMALVVIVTLLAAGTVVLVVGLVFLLATLVPLWAALIITAAIMLIAGGISGYRLVSQRIVLKTPGAREVMNRGRT
ncbi:MAG: hypothetical protein ACM3X8_02405 [Methanomicrobiales archaeon]